MQYGPRGCTRLKTPAGQVDGDGFAEDFPEVWQYRVAQAEGEIEKLWAQQRMISEQLDTLATKEDLKAIEARRTRERDFWASVTSGRASYRRPSPGSLLRS
jgi:hypothetical protein